MSGENVEIVRQAIESNRSDDLEARIEAVLALWDPSCEYTRVTAAIDPQTYRGHNGVRRYMSDMADSWAACLRGQVYPSRQEALEAAGLRE
jgi:hypothetical protein